MEKFKARELEIKTNQLCLGNASKDFSIGNMKKTELYRHAYDLLVN